MTGYTVDRVAWHTHSPVQRAEGYHTVGSDYGNKLGRHRPQAIAMLTANPVDRPSPELSATERPWRYTSGSRDSRIARDVADRRTRDDQSGTSKGERGTAAASPGFERWSMYVPTKLFHEGATEVFPPATSSKTTWRRPGIQASGSAVAAGPDRNQCPGEMSVTSRVTSEPASRVTRWRLDHTNRGRRAQRIEFRIS